MGTRILGTCCTVLLLALPCPADETEHLAFFEKKIRPVLVEHCYECHSVEADKHKGGLYLDSRLGILTGGDSGAAAIPGKPAESLLISAVHYADPDMEMPPKEKLAAEQIADLEKWIAMGMPDPRTGEAPESESLALDLQKGRDFWSFRPITDPPVPGVNDPTWPNNPIDQFVLAELEKQQHRPSPAADPITLRNRTALLLTGLPPTSRSESQSHDQLIDQLLATPDFGERWGRHWLDIVRYADSSGGGRAIPFPDAWRFRDTIIEAFREDRPLDRLIGEHLAGDLIYQEATDKSDTSPLTASAFLVMGPNNYENQDKEELELDIVDEQLDTLGRAFLGMTIGCARCHDHKFDPIPTSDYYALAGIFTSTHSVEHANVSAWHTEALPISTEQQNKRSRAEKRITSYKKEIEEIKKELASIGGKTNSRHSQSVAPEALQGIVLESEGAILAGIWKPSTHQGRYVGDNYLHDENRSDLPKSATFQTDLSEPGSYEIRMAYTTGPSRATGVLVTLRSGTNPPREVRINQRLPPPIDGLFAGLGDFDLDGEVTITVSNQGSKDGHVIVDAFQLLPAYRPNDLTPTVVATSRERELHTALKKNREALKAAEKAAPKIPTTMAVKDAKTPMDTSIRQRGMARNHGETVPRGFLRATFPSDQTMPTITEGSGRLELADWIASADNPLTARVLANRIWLKAMGQGLVRTPDNFGLTGEPPTHPELLDHLASHLVKHNWSTKALLRYILQSRTYQQSSEIRHDLDDPENRLLARAHRRAADAEVLRDRMLLIAGELDRRRGGSPLPENFRSEFGHQITSKRRSVYLPNFRNNSYEFFTTFDAANPNFAVGQRSDSNIPTQALYLLNAPFVHDCADSAADRLRAKANLNSTKERLEFAFHQCLSRPPSAAESDLLLGHLQNHPDDWATIYRVLFASVDFRYIR